jgi:hypothetical protein
MEEQKPIKIIESGNKTDKHEFTAHDLYRLCRKVNDDTKFLVSIGGEHKKILSVSRFFELGKMFISFDVEGGNNGRSKEGSDTAGA